MPKNSIVNESEKADPVVNSGSSKVIPNVELSENSKKVSFDSTSESVDHDENPNQNVWNKKRNENKPRLNSYNSRGAQGGATHQHLPPPAPVKVVGQSSVPVRSKIRPGPYSSSKSSPSRNLKEV